MKKFYSLLSAVLMSALSLTATAQTVSDVVGSYTLEATPLLVNAPEGFALQNSYNITISASETAADSVYMDGFLGVSINNLEQGLSCPIGGKYDDATKTLTFTQSDTTLILSMTTYATITLDDPLVLNVEKDDAGNVTLSTSDNVNFSVVISDTHVDGTLEPFSMTKYKTISMTKEELLGSYAMTYSPLNAATQETMAPVTKTFTIFERNDSLFIKGLGGCIDALPIVLNETGFTIPYAIVRGADYTVQLVNANGFGDLDVAFAENNGLVFTNGIYMIDTRLRTDEDYTTMYVIASTATAKKIIGAEAIAGTYVLNAQPLLSGAPEGVELPSSYNVTITLDDTDNETLYMDGFLGAAIDAAYQSSPIVGKYDFSTETVTFTFDEENQTIMDMTTYGMVTLENPITLSIGKDAEGNITLTSNDDVTFLFDVTDMSTYETVTAKGMLEPFVMTKKKTYTISENDLIGTYKFDYTLTASDQSGTQEASSTFYIYKQNDKFYISGLLGSNKQIECAYNGSSLTIPATMDMNEEMTAYEFVFMSMAMQDVTFDFGENNTIIVPSDGIAVSTTEIGAICYIFSGTITKVGELPEGIENVQTDGLQNVSSVYSIDGRVVSQSKDVNKLSKGLYIIGGKKVIIR